MYQIYVKQTKVFESDSYLKYLNTLEMLSNSSWKDSII
jgi:hypothetical protein